MIVVDNIDDKQDSNAKKLLIWTAIAILILCVALPFVYAMANHKDKSSSVNHNTSSLSVSTSRPAAPGRAFHILARSFEDG